MSDATNKSQAEAYFQWEYKTHGFGAQRRFPNEEMCRFLGRNYFSMPSEIRKSTRILEVGCGAGANLWAIAREGFDAVGVDLSEEGIKLCKTMLASYNTSAELHVADMTKIDLPDQSIDAIVDVFSSHCLTAEQGHTFLDQVARLLKPGGRFFSYFPSTRSDTWSDRNHEDLDYQDYLDDHTLNGLHNPQGPYYGNFHPFRFLHPRVYQDMLRRHSLNPYYCETLTRTYDDQTEIFEFVVVEAQKPELGSLEAGEA